MYVPVKISYCTTQTFTSKGRIRRDCSGSGSDQANKFLVERIWIYNTTQCISDRNYHAMQPNKIVEKIQRNIFNIPQKEQTNLIKKRKLHYVTFTIFNIKSLHKILISFV